MTGDSPETPDVPEVPRGDEPEFRTTAQIVKAMGEGELARFEELYERVAPALFAWARLKLLRELRSRVDPADVVQEVWIRALEIFPRYDAGRSGFRPWLFSVAKLVLLETTKRMRKGPPLVGAPGGTAAQRALDAVPESVTGLTTRMTRDEGIAQFVDHVEGLEALDRQVLVLYGLEGMSGEETGQRLGISREAAFKRWQRVREKLRERGVGRELVVEED